MKSQELNFLTYGSVISISHVQDDHSFITSDGFVKRGIVLKNFHHIDLCSKDDLKNMKSRPQINTLFQIFPKFTNNVKQEILKELSPEEEDEESGPGIQSVLEQIMHNNKQEEISIMSKESVQQYTPKLLQEVKYNLDTFEKAKQLKISYKAPIQLLHIASSKFLACHQKEARFEPSNYKMTLDDLPSDSSLFKIMPAYKYQKEGEQIIYASDIVYIVRASSFMNKLTYLHASGEMGDFGKTSNAKVKNLQVPKQPLDVTKREVNASLDEESQTQWRVSVYSDYIPETSPYLKCGDVIWLHHSESNTTIAATRMGKPINNSNFTSFNLGAYLSAENVELKIMEGRNKESYEEYIGDTYSMWIIESGDYKQGGLCLYGQQYRFKHLASGMYMSGNEQKFYLDKQRNPQSLFQFQPLKNSASREKQIKKGSYVYITRDKVDRNEFEEENYWVDVQMNNSVYGPVMHQEVHKSDQSVFKLYVSSSNDVWEISFILSCIKTLINYYNDIIQLQWKEDASDKELLKDFVNKIQNTRICIENINDFLNNKLYNSTPEQKYGTINPFRQKLLKEQYYIDLLVKILSQGITPTELEIWNSRISIISKQEHSIDVSKASQNKQQQHEAKNKRKGLKDLEKLGFVAMKVQLNIAIYRLLTSVCKNNSENELYTFELVYNFTDHAKYIPETIGCLISIISNNLIILNRLSANVMIDFDYKEVDFFEPEEEKMQLQQNENNANNLLMFFLNLLENEDQAHKADFLTFLRSMCIFNNAGINQNQELIYKLVKKYNKEKVAIVREREDLEKLSVKEGRLMIPIKAQNDHKELLFVNEQLQFFADVSFGRNYLWKRELGQCFSEEFLFQNIWTDNKMYQPLQASLCKIAMSLYVDHDPRNRYPLPQFCQLYKSVDSIEQRSQQPDQYKRLISDLFTYLQSHKESLVNIMKDDKQANSGESKHDYSQVDQVDNHNLLQNELLSNSTQMVRLLLELDVFNLLNQDPSKYYEQIVDIIAQYFFYDFKNLTQMRDIYKHQQKEMEGRKQRKDQKKALVGINLNLDININPLSLLSGDDKVKEEDDEDEEQHEAQIDDVQMWTNPLMRGYVKLQNELDGVVHEEKGTNQWEIKIKLTICDILDRFLDMRQNYLMANVLAFFKIHIIEAVPIETKEDKEMEKLLTNQGKFEEEIAQYKIEKHIERKITAHILGLLPSIAKSGITEIDEVEVKEDAFQMLQSFGNLMKNRMMNETEPLKEEFTIYTTKVLQIYDPDTYFSLALGDDDPKNPVSCLLPYLLTSFTYIHDETLEKRTLSIIMRLFNQREELSVNISKLQLVSDNVKSKLFEYLSANVLELNRLIDKSEVWMTDFIKYDKGVDLEDTTKIIKNFRMGFFKDTVIINNEISSKCIEIDHEKQNLMNALKIYVPILNLIRDQMQSFNYQLNKMQNVVQKQKLSMLFIYSFQFLRNFCKGNHDNQLLLHNNLNDFQNLEVEVGQIPLICEIYKDNTKLLTTVNQAFLRKFVTLIEQGGRKEQYLEPFMTIILQGSKYIFDNQLIVLNTFLSRNYLLFSQNHEFLFEGQLQVLPSDFLSELANTPIRDQPYRYHAKLLELLLACTFIKVDTPNDSDMQLKDNFTINVAKLKKSFKSVYLLGLLCHHDSFTTPNPNTEQKGLSLLKRQLCQFFRYVHITSEKSHSINSEIVADFIKLVEFETRRLENIASDINLNKYIDYLVDAILPLFSAYCERKHLQAPTDEDEEAHDQEQRDIAALHQFAKRLSISIKNFLLKFLTKKKHAHAINLFIANFPQTPLGKCLQDQGQQDDESDFAQVRSHLQNLLAGVEEQLDQGDNRYGTLQPPSPMDSGLGSSRDLPKTIFNESKLKKPKHIVSLLMGKKKQQQEEEPLIEYADELQLKINLSWEEFTYQFVNGEKLEMEIKAELKVLSDAILKFENYFAKGGPKVELKVLVTKLIKFLQYALNTMDQEKTIITLLSVLRMVIDQSDDELGNELRGMFNKLGATRMVLTVISESAQMDSQLFMNFMMFINTLLSGGNLKVQKTIYEFMKTYPKSEVIFQRLNNVIHLQIQQIMLKAKEKKEESGEQSVQEQKQQKEQEDVMNHVLKFLQNCCEGHYLDLQNYIRQQTNSRNSYNMINMVADLLRAYYYEDRAQYYNMTLCLDTLNELVQGPCPENQVAVAESKFFEIASDLFTTKKDKENARAQSLSTNVKSSTTKMKSSANRSRRGSQKSNDLENWQIERLQMKCLILILSLIEMRDLSDSNPIIKRIMRNLSMNVLQKHMVKCYAKYEQQCPEGYQIEVLDRVKAEPEKQEFEEAYYELILQKGFYIFFLMCYYMESDKHSDHQFIQMYKAHTRKKLKQDKNTLEDLLFGDNIIGQLVSFVMSLANSWFELVNYFKQKALEGLKRADLSPEEIERQEREKIARKKQLSKDAFKFFVTNSAAIEVIRNNEIEIVYFILLPYTHNLPKEKKNEFHELVDRSSTKSKVQYLVTESTKMIEICEHEETLRRIFQRQKFLALFANYVKLWKDLAFIFTLLLNLFIIGSFAEIDGDRMESYKLFQKDEYTSSQTKSIFLICGSIMACCSIFVVMFFLFKNAPLIIRKAWQTKLPFEDEITYWPFQLLLKLVKLVAVLFYILKEIEVVYYLAYGALAVIGTIVHPFFFSFHLTEILIRYPTLKNVIRSVWEPKQQLALTLVLFIILVYVYGLIAYTFFYEDYDGRCQSTLHCFLFTFDWTFKANGGVGGYLSDLEGDNDPDRDDKYQVGRFAYDNTSNIFLVIIMVNIVAGIIIDTFGSLREQEQDKIRDIEDKCFICGNLKTTFDRLTDSAAGGGFLQHIKINHYMWNYVFFMAYLYYKDPTEYTGIEQYVNDKINKKDLTWFPFNRARELQGLKQEEEEESIRVEKISTDMSGVMEQMKQASQTLNLIKNKKNQRQNQQEQ